MTDEIFIFHFGLFFALSPPSQPKKSKLKKWKKSPGEIIILHMCTKNYDQMMYGDRWRDCRMNRQTVGQLGGQTEKMTYRGGCST